MCLQRHAPAIVVKVDVGASLEVLSGNRGFLVPLEPSHVVFVEPPRVPLQLSGCQILLVGALHARAPINVCIGVSGLGEHTTCVATDLLMVKHEE